MASSLAVIAPQVGALSETFIRRHMDGLYPGRTVTIAGTANQPYAGHWTIPGPLLLLDRQHRGQGDRVQRFVRRRLGLPAADEARPIKEFLTAHGVTAILGEYLDLAFPYLEPARQLGIPFFGHAHGYDVSLRLREPEWREKYLRYNEAAGIITMSEASRKRLLELGLDAGKVHVVPYGVDVPAQPVLRDARQAVRCVAVGRMAGKKAPILTLDAFRRAASACPHLHLDYVGGGALLPAARQFVQAFGLEAQVTLHGPQPSEFVLARMTEADIFLQHSMVDPDTGDEEGLPVAILEAMALALPVVSTYHAGIPEAVLDGETGYLVNEGESAAMGERLAALASDPEGRTRMGQAGWARAKSHFTWPRERDRLLEVMGLPALRPPASAHKDN